MKYYSLFEMLKGDITYIYLEISEKKHVQSKDASCKSLILYFGQK